MSFSGDMILHRENPKEPTKNYYSSSINEFGKVAGYNINIQKLTVFPYTCNKQS